MILGVWFVGYDQNWQKGNAGRGLDGFAPLGLPRRALAYDYLDASILHTPRIVPHLTWLATLPPHRHLTSFRTTHILTHPSIILALFVVYSRAPGTLFFYTLLT